MIWINNFPTALQPARFQHWSGLTVEEINRAHWNCWRARASLFANRVIVPVMRECMRRRVKARAA